ncbi:MAG: sigma-70 family RNA polymerase sigma factor [Patescibacteria group bacterium]
MVEESLGDQDVTWLLKMLRASRINIIDDASYVGIADASERTALKLERQYGEPINDMLAHLYLEMKIGVEAVAAFFDVRVADILLLLQRYGIKRNDEQTESSECAPDQLDAEKSDAMEKEYQIGDFRFEFPKFAHVDAATLKSWKHPQKKNEEEKPYSRKTSLEKYLEEIRQYRLLSKKETQKITEQAKAGDEVAFVRLYLANLLLTVYFVKRLVRRQPEKFDNIDIQDLIVAGNEGLMVGLRKFDPSLGFSITTYVQHWIVQSVQRYIYNYGETIRKPVHMQEQLNQAERTVNTQLSASKNLAEINVTALSVDEARQLLSAHQDCLSLDDTDDGEKSALSSRLMAVNNIDPLIMIEAKRVRQRLREQITKLRSLLDPLPFYERVQLACRFGLCGIPAMTLGDIGDKVSLTRERIRQKEVAYMTKLGIDADAYRTTYNHLMERIEEIDSVIGM